MIVPSHVRWPLAALLVAHGAIHVLGLLRAFGAAAVEEIGGPTLFIAEAAPGEPASVAFGFLWLVSMLALIAAGIGVARRKTWGLPLAGIGSVMSLISTIVWWSSAWIGAVLSGAILVFCTVAILSPATSKRMASGGHGGGAKA